MRKLSVVIPAYNEEKRMPKTLKSVLGFLSVQAYTSEIIVVDDASSDNTYDLVKKIDFRKSKTDLKILQHAYNKGKGAAVRTGVLASEGDYILFMDADNSTDISEIKKLLPFIKSYNIIIGSRYLNKNSVKIKQPLLRRVISRLGNQFIKLFLKLNYADTQCGFKLFEAQTAKKIFSKITINRWGFDIEILFIAKNFGYKVKEVPVDWYDSPNSQLRSGKAAYNTLKELIKIKSNYKKGLYK